MASKADRLRDFLRERKQAPLLPVPSAAEWERLVQDAELTPDDLALLAKQVAGHRERARRAHSDGDAESLGFEAQQALALNPLDTELVDELRTWLTEAWLAEAGASTPELTAVRQRVQRARARRFTWWPWAAGAAVVALAVALVLWHPWSSATSAPPAVQQQTRDLPLTLDTPGVKNTLTVQHSRLQIYAEAKVLDLAAEVTFPEHRVSLWEGQLRVLDDSGAVVFEGPVTLHPSSDGDVEPGQVINLRRQWDAEPWKGVAARVSLETLQLEALPATASAATDVELVGRESLGKGWALSVVQLGSEWKDGFATKTNRLRLQVTNSGLKPFQSLHFAIEWRGANGDKLKTTSWPVVAEAQAGLVPGGRASSTLETVFETELFSWSVGQEPHPLVRLTSWK